MKIISAYLSLVLISFSANAENEWLSVQPSFQQVTVTGFSRARYSMVLSTEVVGKVEKVYVDVGGVVAKHGKIACLDKTFVEIDINSATNEIEQHQVDIRFFNKQVDRYQDLVGKNSAAISQLDDFQRQLGNAKRFKQSKKIQQQRLQEKLKRHCVKSPAGWRMMERHVEPGQWLDIGTTVAKVGDYSNLLVPLALSVRELAALQNKPDNFKVLLTEYNLKVPASIARVSPAFDERSRKVQVDLLLQKNLPVARGGLRVEVILQLPESSGTYLISEKSLDKRFEEVWITRKDGKSLRVEILGTEPEGQVRIFSPEIKPEDKFKLLHP